MFGFSPLSLLLPEAIIGVLSVAALFALMRRPFGLLAALAGALTLAVFPSFVAASRDNGVDPFLILLMLLACGAALRAIRRGRWPALLASAVLVGLAFNAKTLAAYRVPGYRTRLLPLCARVDRASHAPAARRRGGARRGRPLMDRPRRTRPPPPSAPSWGGPPTTPR